MIVEDHDTSDRFSAFGDGSRRNHEDSLLAQRCGIRQPVGSNHHHSFLKHSKTGISERIEIFPARDLADTGSCAISCHA